jgi:hypothetical protein
MLPGYALGLDPFYYSSSSLTDGSRWCSQDTLLAAGDYGSPGEENRYCPSFDHDGDGYSLNDGDCDDRDGAKSPGAGERLDGLDNDCDGLVDAYIMTEANTAFVQGDYNEALGYRYSLGTGDLDADGAVELVVGGVLAGDYDNGAVYVLEGSDYAGWAGPVSGYAEANILGNNYGTAAVVSPQMADNSGDGRADLVVAGADAYYGNSGLENFAVYRGPLSGALGPSDADLTLTGLGAANIARLEASLDFNGDGVAEIVYAEPQTAQLVVVNSYGVTGAMQVADVDSYITGSSDGLGNAMSGADVDGDGYDDLLTCAIWDNSYTGAAYLVSGQNILGVTDDISNLYTVKFTGGAVNDYYCYGAHPQIADLDGDSAVDLVVGAPQISTVYLYSDLASLQGTVATSVSTERYTSTTGNLFGWALENADMDGDGSPELLVGEPSTNYNSSGSPGYAWIFTDVGSGLSQTPADALFSFRSGTSYDNLGFDLMVQDLDGNGTLEVAIAAPGDNGSGYYSGWLWIPEL